MSTSTSTTMTGGDETPPETLVGESTNKSPASEQLLDTNSSTSSTTMSAEADETNKSLWEQVAVQNSGTGSSTSSPNHDLNNPTKTEDHHNGVEEPGILPLLSSFPVTEMVRLDEMISNPRWVVPVLPGGQLEVLLDASIEFARVGLDLKSEPCQRFIRDGLTISFNKILTDDAVSSWKPEIHKCILKNSERLIDLIVIKLDQDCLPLLDLMGVLFNPSNKFHSYNSGRQCETISGNPVSEDELFAKPAEMRVCKGWLVDLLNRFGAQGGFQIVSNRFGSTEGLSVTLVYAYVRPFGLCAEFLTKYTVEKFFQSVLRAIPQFLENLSDEELKKETARSDLISSIIRCLKSLQSRISEADEHMRNLEIFRLRMILRMLRISSFNGKMNALNEINQVIQNVSSHYTSHHYRLDDVEYLSPKRIAEWLAENQVLQIVLRDSLHQPQYVEKLEKILRFIIKERSLTLTDLDDIWAAQVGKHDAIVKNLHDLLAKLAWDFSPDQLDHLFECFQASWTTANRRQREKLLELIRRLAEDDKDGVMAFKVLTLFWNLAHSNEVPTEIMDQALTAHVKVLDYSCSQQRDTHKLQWLNKSVDQLDGDDVIWVLPAMKHIKEIFCLYPEGSSNKNPNATYRHQVINQMQNDRQLIVKVCASLNIYMEKVRAHVKEKGPIEPHILKLDGRYSHLDQIRERLLFLKFMLKEGQLWLCEEQANQIWHSLAENPAFTSDREMCFEWFSKLMGEDPDIDPGVTMPFFEGKILNFDATAITENGLECFERFFRVVNVAQKKLLQKREEYVMDDLELVGTDYIWRVILSGSEDMANRAIGFLRSIFTALGPKLMPNQIEVHEDFISSCMDRLKASYDTMKVLEKDKDSTNVVRQEVTRACRVLRVLFEYIVECDSEYGEERAFIPLYRASRGKNLTIFVRVPCPGSRGFEDLDIHTHTNETPAGLRRQIIRQLKEFAQITTAFKVDFCFNGEIIELSEDRRTVQQYGLRDKLIMQAKVVQNNVTNSPDSSEESSGGSPNHFTTGVDGPNIEAEESLPSVMISKHEKRMEFLCQLCGLGTSIGDERLRDGARTLLSVLPGCRFTEKSLRDAFLIPASQFTEKKPYDLLFNTEPAVVLYRLEVLYSMILPAVNTVLQPTMELLAKFFISGGASMVVEMLTKNNFMPLADLATKRSAYLAVLKLTKAVLAVTSILVLRCESDSSLTSGSDRLRVLTEAIKSVPHPNTEATLRSVADQTSKVLFSTLKQNPDGSASPLRQIVVSAMNGMLPDLDTIRLLIRLASSTASGSLAHFSSQQHQANREPPEDDVAVCEEALETLTIGFVLNPNALEVMMKDPSWKGFLHQVLFYTHGRSIRYIAHEQVFAIATKCTGTSNVILFFITLMFDIVQTSVRELPHHSRDVFHLLCNLLHYYTQFGASLPKHEQLLTVQIDWLRKAKEYIKIHGEGCLQEDLLEGHTSVARELTSFLSPEKKYELGSDPAGLSCSLIKEVLEEFVFPWSKAFSEMRKSGEISSESPIQICSAPSTQTSMLDLVASLCTGSYPNLKLTVELLTQLFNYSIDGDGALEDWEYIPPVGNRPMGGFVGLKNAGATCYMNSVLQQLFMVDYIKKGLLGVNMSDTDDELREDVENRDSTDSVVISQSSQTAMDSNSDERKEYNVCILKQLQCIFGHLALSKLQYYVPNGLWKHFRLQGEAINVREQQDAVEFFMSLVESVDDGLKAVGEEQVMSKNLSGLFSDQKICKECPHRYSKEEPFCVISVDIRNHSSLLESLEQYVKGELLEGADAYHCERCNKKVVTVKRLCVKKLPPVLAIQLKRFEYDYERVCPIKFNDYFEFPRDLDMEPYTVSGLAKIEGEIIDADDSTLLGQNICTSYRLTGIVVHSGQASGGHYYSYISMRCNDGLWRWYKFDDGDVTECRMDDDEELKNQCFGGDYSGEVFDHMIKRMSFRRQKRWWNAYILFYTQTDVLDNLSTKFSSMSIERKLKIPPRIERSVLKQNVEFMHVRSHFSVEYFQFVKKLVASNHYLVMGADPSVNEDLEKLALLSIQLASRFLFTVGFRTKKNLRGQANDWYEVIAPYLKVSKAVRFWFATHALFQDPRRIGEYLLECTSSEVRLTFSKILVMLAHLSKHDGVYIPTVPMATLARTIDKNACLWEYILEAVLNLLRRDVSEYGRHLVQYFGFFVNYSNLGDEEKIHLLKLEVPATFMLVAIDDGPAPPIKYQCADLSKLYQCVSILVRSCDVSARCKSVTPEESPKPNPFLTETAAGPLLTLPQTVCDILYGRGPCNCSPYIKKILDETNGSEDTLVLLQFLSWENAAFSQVILSEVLGKIGYLYTQELKVFLEILISLLKLEDSWQLTRISNALKGLPDDKDGLIDIIDRNKTSQPKRAYLFLKCITNMMERGSLAHKVLSGSAELSRKWNLAVDWLHHELDRRGPAGGSSYGYATATWFSPSNESANGSFFLERSLSAKTTLEKAVELRVEPEQEGNEEDQISSEGEEDGEKVTKDALDDTGTDKSQASNFTRDSTKARRVRRIKLMSNSTGTNHWGPSSVCNENLQHVVNEGEIHHAPAENWELKQTEVDQTTTTTTTTTTVDKTQVSIDQFLNQFKCGDAPVVSSKTSPTVENATSTVDTSKTQINLQIGDI